MAALWSPLVATTALTMPDLRAAPKAAGIAQLRAAAWTALDTPAFAARWAKLAAAASEPNPFLESWYLLPALRAFDSGGRIQLLRLEQDGVLIGLLPLARSARYYSWPIPHLAGWSHANAFLGAPLVAAGREVAFWEGLLDWADRHAGSALFLHLAELPIDGALYQALNEVCGRQHSTSGIVHRSERAMLDSALDPEAYHAAALTAKKRKELRRQHARLSELGSVAVERTRDAAGLDQWIGDFLALERAGWKGAAGSAMACDHGTEALFRQALTGAAAAGKLERLAITLDGAPIAMLATFLSAPGAFSYKTAFDERFSRFSPGVLLQRENLALLDDPAIAWCDSCAASDHPMIDHFWRERRAIGRVSVAIGGPLRRALFRGLLRAELGRNPAGVAA